MKCLSYSAVVFAGLAILPPGAKPPVPADVLSEDLRLARLVEFFEKRDSPIQHLAADFLDAADRFGLDWRLLPAIAVVESGAGKLYRNNNIFGWDSGRQAFSSIQEGIQTVASRLALSKLYRDKELDEILQTYNTHPDYPRHVKAVMEQLGPADIRVVD